MKRSGILLSLSAISFASGYLLNSPQASLIGMAILAYYSTAKTTFKPKVQINRFINGILRVNEPAHVRVKINNMSEAEGVLKLIETSEDVHAEVLEIPLKPRERVEVFQKIIPRRRGKIKLKGIAIFEDSLGLFSRKFPVRDVGELTVLPRPREIASGLKARRHLFTEEVSRELGTGTDTLEFEELREFLPGDNIRRIDWKATSRLQKLVVRVYRRESFSEIVVLINLDPAFRRGLKGDKIDYLSKLISQLLGHIIKSGYNVMIIAYDRRDVLKTLPMIKNAESALNALELTHEKGLPPISPSPLTVKTLRRGNGLLKALSIVKGSPFVIVIDDIGLAPRSIMEAARLIRRRGLRGLVISPNPIYFLRKSDLNEKNILSVYNAYIARKRLAKSLSSLIPIIEVGPRDLLEEVVKRV
jgi:uncharacterized protein (DUF58 family)